MFKKGALVVFSLLLCAGATEFFLAIGWPQLYDMKINYAWRESDPLLPYIPKKNYRGRMVLPLQFDAPLTINAQGFRGTSPAFLEKPAGKRRILVMGDSFMFGWGVSDEEVISHHLKLLPRTDVINAAVFGYGVLEYREILNRMIKYKPDVVILGFTLENDFEIESNLNREFVQKIKKLESKPTIKERLRTFLNRRHIVAFLRDRLYINFPKIRNFLFSLGITQKRDIFLRQTPAHLVVKQREVARLLREMALFTEERHSEFLVVIIPLREQICCQNEINKFAEFQATKPNEDLQKILNSIQIRYVDLLPYFLDEHTREPQERFYYDNDPHWTAAGHKLAARIISENARASAIPARH